MSINNKKLYNKSMSELLGVIKDNRRSRLAPDTPKFIDYAWKNFDPLKIASLLLSEQETYNGLREILFAGFCTWVVCPRSPHIIKKAMIREAVDYISDIEELAWEGSKNETVSLVLSHAWGLGPDFLQDFYFPIGGLATICRLSAGGDYLSLLQSHSTATPTIISMMKVYDFHFKHLQDEAIYYPISTRKAAKMVSAISSDGGVGEERAEVLWQQCNTTAAFLYAASTLNTKDYKTLLGKIISGRISYDADHHFFGKWCSRARYVADHILAKTNDDGRLSKINLLCIPNVSFEPTPEPDISENHGNSIADQFNKKLVLLARSEKRRANREGKNL